MPTDKTACQIKLGAERGLVTAIRKLEAEVAEAWARLHNESGDAVRAMQRMSGRRAEQLQTAEEAGYERGLADGRAKPATRADTLKIMHGEARAADVPWATQNG